VKTRQRGSVGIALMAAAERFKVGADVLRTCHDIT
jgi:hypothetical protein